MYVRTRESLGLGLTPYTEASSSSYIGEPKSLPKVECSRYEKGEVEKSHCQEGPCQQGHLVADVIRHPRGLLIADFGVGWSGIKAATRKEKLLQDWMGEAKTNLYSIILRIYGYSDCVGTEKNNQALRYARAERVYGLLDKALQSRVDFMGAARPGEYVADNKTKEGRANNRGVIIELFRLSEEIVDITDTRCLRPNCPPPPPPPKRCIPPNCPPPPPPKRCIPPNCPPPPPPKRPDIDPRWRPPRIPFPGLSPKEILDRAREVLEYLKRNGGDQSLIKKLQDLLSAAAPIVTLAGAVFGLYIFAKGKLVQVAVATGMGLLPRILHRFETSGMKEALERILNELTDPKTTEPIKQEIRRTQPRGAKSALTECQEKNPTFAICKEQFDIGPEKIVMNFLKNEGIDPNDVLGINCRKFNSFGPGVIDDCNHAPGETWHCTVTTKVPGSLKLYVRVVSLFRCLCCRADGWAAHDWRGPHWSTGSRPRAAAGGGAAGLTALRAEAQTLVQAARAGGRPVVVNLGGAGEVAGAINLNPLVSQQTRGIPNLIRAPAERVGEIFFTGSVDQVVSNNIILGQVNWSSAARGAFTILRPGGTVSVAPFASQLTEHLQLITQALRQAGFRDVTTHAGRFVTAVRP